MTRTRFLGLALALATAGALAACSLTPEGASGEPKGGGAATRAALRSPEVLPDRRVTFRVRAPNAKVVTLTPDWAPPNTQIPMARGAQGVWSVTLGPLEPGLAIYNFTVDGTDIADPVNPRMKLRASTSASLVDVPGDGSEPWQVNAVAHGRVEINYLPTKAIGGQTREVRVYTPPGYDERAGTRYPVVYLFHGTNDTAAGWTDVGRANYILDNLIAQQKAVPMILVMPWGHATPYAAGGGGGPGGGGQAGGARGNGRGGGGRGGQGGPTAPSANDLLFERYLLEDLMPAIDAGYRVAPGRENRAIVGLSMGGGQALYIGLHHLDLFGSVGEFSAPVPRDFETLYAPLLADAAGTNGRIGLFFLGCGKVDKDIERTRELDAILERHGIRHTFVLTEGYHNYTNWRQHLAAAVPLLFRQGGTPAAGR